MRRLLTGAVAAFLVAGSTALFSSPAQAAEHHVSVELSSTKVQAGGSKLVTFTVTNIGDKPLVKPVLAINQESYHYEVVRYPFNAELCRPGPVLSMDCPLTPDPLLPGRSAKVTTTFEADDDAPVGSAGTLIVYVLQDGVDGGETFEFPLTVEGKPGPDLFAYAADVPPTGALEPGVIAPLIAGFANQGNVPADGITIKATVPAGAHFVTGQPGDFTGCEFALRTVTCSFGDEVLPADSGLQPVVLPVRLDDNAKPGVNLTKGKVEITGKPASAPEQTSAKRTAASFPKGLTLPADTLTDADLADNDDTFTVVVAKAADNNGNNNGNGSGTGGGTGDDDPTLPITGPVAASAAGTGAALVAVGVLLLMITRRRSAARRE